MAHTGGIFHESQEFRNVLFSVEAIVQLPRTLRTEYREDALHSALSGT